MLNWSVLVCQLDSCETLLCCVLDETIFYALTIQRPKPFPHWSLLFTLTFFQNQRVFFESMLFAQVCHLSCLLVFLSHLTASEKTANLSLSTSTPSGMIVDGNSTLVATSTKNRILPGPESLNNAFAKMDRNTVIRAVIVLAGITGLVLMYVGIKTVL